MTKNNSFSLFSKIHFDILKGIAILLVVLAHVGNFSGVTWFTPLGGIGVAIFLFCSGYGLFCSYQQNGLKSFWQKRLISVYLPFFISEAIASLILKRSLVVIILNFLLVKPAHGFMWYMQYLFGCYIIFWIVFKFVKKTDVQVFIFLFLSVLSFFIFDDRAATQAFTFSAGVLTSMWQYSNKKQIKISFLKGASLLVIAALFLALKQLPFIRAQHHYIVTLINLILKTSAAFGIIVISFVFKKLFTLLKYPGQISYPLYLIHGYFMFILDKNVFGSFIFNALAAFIFSVFLSIVYQMIIKKLTSYLQSKIFV